MKNTPNEALSDAEKVAAILDPCGSKQYPRAYYTKNHGNYPSEVQCQMARGHDGWHIGSGAGFPQVYTWGEDEHDIAEIRD
jgi:hypothetical protein